MIYKSKYDYLIAKIMPFLSIYYGMRLITMNYMSLGDIIFDVLLATLCVATRIHEVRVNSTTWNKCIVLFSCVSTTIGFLRLAA